MGGIPVRLKIVFGQLYAILEIIFEIQLKSIFRIKIDFVI